MAATPQSQAINGANDLLYVMQQLQQVRATVDNFVRQYVAANYSAEWNAFPTAIANTDGSLGTADGAPNTARPIDTRVAAMANLQIPLSAANLVNGVALLQALQNFFTNGVVATSNRDAVLNLFRAG